MAAQTRSACRSGDHASGIIKVSEPTVFEGLSVNLLGAGNNNASYILMNLKSLKDRCGCTYILEPSVCAGTYYYLIDPKVFAL